MSDAETFMSPTWDLKQLRDDVLKNCGKTAYFEVWPCMQSICERQEFARFHYQEAKNLHDLYLEGDTSEADPIRAAFGLMEREESLERFKFKARAHVLALIQSLHGLSDTLSHVIYYSLGLSEPKKERDISMRNVESALKGDPRLSHLADLVESLTNHDDFRYLSALSNHSKHRSIISSGLRYNLKKEGKEMKELVFPSFEHDKKQYPSKFVYDFIGLEYERQGKLIIQIGNELNKIVRSMVSE